MPALLNKNYVCSTMRLPDIKNKLQTLFLDRTARTIFFWLFIIVTKIMGTTTVIPPARYYALLGFNILFFIVPCTLNNYVFIPRLLRRGQRLWYLALALGMIYLLSAVYALWLKFLSIQYPAMELFDVSIVIPDLSPDLSLRSVLLEKDSIFWIMLMLVFGFTGAWYISDHTRNEKRLQETLQKQMETELNFLKSQINPHFLFNTLNNLYGLALKKADEAPEAILKLSSILRYILYESNVELISFEKEKEIMQAYIDIEMLRLSESEHARFSILSDRPRQIPPLLWLPVLENMFKHAVAEGEDSVMEFRFALQGSMLSIYSKNSFRPGKARGDSPGGIGLSNLRKRLDILYPGKHSIEAGDDGEFYSVNVQITWHG